METVTITLDEYKKLLVAAFELDCLEDGGVDNWAWYSESFDQNYYDTVKALEKATSLEELQRIVNTTIGV